MRTPTLLPLETFREIAFDINPWHFWGFANSTVPVSSACNSVMKEYTWQNTDAAGRESLRKAIASAEERVVDVLNFWPAPHYHTQMVSWPRYADPSVSLIGYIDGSGRWQSVDLNERHVLAAGVEARTEIGLAQAVVYSDEDGDTLEDTFTVTVATSLTDPSEIAIYFAEADRFDGSAVSESWRISPVRVTISGGNATITGKKWLMGKPVNYEGFNKENLDPAEPDNFITTVDVYRYFTDPTGTTLETAQAYLEWETNPMPGWGGFCGGDPTNPSGDPAALAQVIGRVGLRDGRLGQVSVGEAVYNVDSGVWSSPGFLRYRPPDRAFIRYLAGFPLGPDNRMDSRMAKIVARLAAGELTERICACKEAARSLERWQRNLARTVGPDQFGAVTSEELQNPFGTTEGAVDAWRQTKSLRVIGGFSP